MLKSGVVLWGLFMLLTMNLVARDSYGQPVMEFEAEDFADDYYDDDFMDDFDDFDDFGEFDDEEDVDFTFEDPAPVLPRVAALTLRSGDAEEEMAFRLTQALMGELQRHNIADVVDAEELRARLLAPGQDAALDCATNPTCLAGYGRDLWFDKIIIGVLYKDGDTYRFNVNMVDVDSAEVESYVSPTARSPIGSVQIRDLADTVVRRLFNIRDLSAVLDEGRRTQLVPMRGPTQTRMAIGTAGLSVVTFAVGMGFGISAKGIENDLRQSRSITQVRAEELVQNGKDRALYANVFYAASAASLAASAALYFIKPLQEVEVAGRGFGPVAESGTPSAPGRAPGGSGGRRIRLISSIGAGHAGLGAKLDF